MHTESVQPTATKKIESLVQSHKAHLASKYAFLISQDLINKVKNNNFTLPPRRCVDEIDGKLEEEANTSTSSAESIEAHEVEREVRDRLAAGLEDQASTANKLMQVFLSFEEHLTTSGRVSSETVTKIRKFNRLLLAQALALKAQLKRVPRESVAMAVMQLSVEKFGLDKSDLKEFVQTTLQMKKINKLAEIKEQRAYKLLTIFLTKVGNLRL